MANKKTKNRRRKVKSRTRRRKSKILGGSNLEPTLLKILYKPSDWNMTSETKRFENQRNYTDMKIFYLTFVKYHNIDYDIQNYTFRSENNIIRSNRPNIIIATDGNNNAVNIDIDNASYISGNDINDNSKFEYTYNSRNFKLKIPSKEELNYYHEFKGRHFGGINYNS